MKTKLLIIIGMILLSISIGTVYAECSEQDRDACFDSNGKFDYDAYEDSFWEPVKVQHNFEKNSTVTFEHKKEGLGLRGTFTATQEDVVTMTVPRNLVDSIHRNCDPDEIMLLAKYDKRYANTTPHKGFYQESFLADQIMNQTHRVVTLKVLPTMLFEFMGSFPLGLVGEMLDTCGAPNGYLTYYTPPKFQLEHDVTFEDIKCNDDLVLIQKYDGSPVCVRYQTAVELTDKEKRSGWKVGDQLWQSLSEEMNEFFSDDGCPKYCIIFDEKYLVDDIDKTLGNSTGLPKFLPEGYDYFQFYHRETYSVIQISTKPISPDISWNDFYWKDSGIFLRYSEVPVTIDGRAQTAHWAKNNDAQKLDLSTFNEPVYLKERKIFYDDKLNMPYPTLTEAQFNHEELTVIISGYVSGEEMLKVVNSFFES